MQIIHVTLNCTCQISIIGLIKTTTILPGFFLEDTVVHEFAGLALCSMAQDFSSKVNIYQNNGMEPLIQCLGSHDPDVKKNAIETISLLLQVLYIFPAPPLFFFSFFLIKKLNVKNFSREICMPFPFLFILLTPAVVTEMETTRI